ncbi:MAG TPA: matrixin family metalloprotease [Pyrinomonadaceae bacterium]|nr:matrixin family metalloprotease [Pyrinomonadaceae bacterium]
MKIRTLSKELFDVLAVRTAFALGLGALMASLILPEVRPATAQQITSCVEAPSTIAGTSITRAVTKTDCDPGTAARRARDASEDAARDDISQSCRNSISVTEAEEICRNAGGLVPVGGTTLSASPVARPGGAAIDTQLPITNTNPRLCTVLRDRGTQTSTGQAGWENGFCVLNDNRLTFKTVSTNARCGVQCRSVIQHPFRVRRFTNTNMPAGEADQILAAASSILRVDDGAGDVGCRIGLSRIRDLTTFSQGDGSIDSAAEFATVMGLAGDVKVVNAINFCGGLIPNVLGCAPIGGGSFTVVRFGSQVEIEAIAWAHEFGHNQGLPHRNDQNAIMNGTISATNRRVTTGECSAFQEGGEAEITSVLNASLFKAARFKADDARSIFAVLKAEWPQTQSVSAMDIKEFVRQTFIHGVPYEEASKYPPNVVPTLMELLANREWEPHWPNIVVALGMIGDERAVSPLIEFVERARGGISATHYRAKSASVMSLGYLINKTGSEKALAYLVRGLDPRIWNSRVGSNRAPYQTTSSERDFALAKQALLGLALSGHPKAGQALQSLKQPAGNQVERKFRTQMSDLLTEALKEHQQIANRGLVDYYRSN